MKLDVEKLKGGLLYSEELGIKLKKNNDEESFKWFLASILFGARISETIAKNTYRAFEKYNLLDPQKILDAGWDFLVNPVMREGGYVRYDFKTSTKMLRICEKLTKEYDKSLRKLHNEARDKDDLENRLLSFYGIGPVTVNIFLRELRPYWDKADPEPLPMVKQIAQRLGVDLNSYNRKGTVFTRIEASLIRLRKSKLISQST